MKIGLMIGLYELMSINKMKRVIILIICLVIGFSTKSQIKPESNVTLISDKGDTLIQIKSSDTKIILKDVSHKQVMDTVVKAYIVRDTLQNSIATLEVNVSKNLEKLPDKDKNKDIILNNLNKVVEKKDNEITKLNDVVKKQEKEIKKQKFLKLTAYVSGVILPVMVKLIFK